MKALAYIFGQPGAGKTTLMRAICGGAALAYEAKSPVLHRGFSRNGMMFAVLGRDAHPFGGTDTLSYNAVGTADVWLSQLSECAAGSLVFAEGDRLANDRFFESASKLYRLLTFHLCCQGSEAARRRSERALQNGLSLQSASWVKGRATKNDNLAKRLPDSVELDATLPASVLAANVWRHVESKLSEHGQQQ